MLEINKTITGTCSIEITENESTIVKQVAYLNATIPQNGEFSINKVIQERELFNNYKEIIVSDFDEFEKYICELICQKEEDTDGKK